MKVSNGSEFGWRPVNINDYMLPQSLFNQLKKFLQDAKLQPPSSKKIDNLLTKLQALKDGT